MSDHSQRDEQDHEVSTSTRTRYDPPTLPAPAIAWLTGSESIVLNYSAGVGSLCQGLLDLDHELYAVDSNDDLLSHLRLAFPDVPTAIASPDAIPLPDNSVEVVVWAEPKARKFWKALGEITRVLRVDGKIAVAWSVPDTRIPWVRRLCSMVGITDPGSDLVACLAEFGAYGEPELNTFAHWTQLERDDVERLARAQPAVSAADERAQSTVLAEVRQLYAEYERGIDGLRLPYVAHCLRATLRPPEEEAVIPPGSAVEEDPGNTPLITFN